MPKNLTYEVIVIDDDEDIYKAYIDQIGQRLEEEGYELKHDRIEKLPELDGITLKEVDLFLVDLKFGNDDIGNKFIDKIRENNCLTDILFYSNDGGAIKIHRESGKYQGVYFAVRDEHTNQVENLLQGLVEKLIRRANTPTATRGIVLGCVAGLDTIIKSKIIHLIENIQPEIRAEIDKECIRLFRESNKGRLNKMKNFFGADFITEIVTLKDLQSSIQSVDLTSLIRDIDITDSNKNFKLLLSIYKKIRSEDNLYHSIVGFEQILGERNILAHVEEELSDTGEYRFKHPKKDEYLSLCSNKCKELRKAIIEYEKQLMKVL